MGLTVPVLLFAAGSFSVGDSGHMLRKSCDPYDVDIARLPAGSPIQIRFAMNGEYGACYKVVVQIGDRRVEGWLPAKAITGLEIFERGRQEAQSFDSPQAVRQDIAAVQKEVSGKIQLESGDHRLADAARLLESNQPAEALRIVETALRDNRSDPALLALAGVAAFQSDDARLAVDYLQRSLQISPNPAVDRMLVRARRESQEDQSSAKLYGSRFLLRYDPREVTGEQARSILPMLDQEFARVSESLGCRVEERIVAVLQGVEAYRRTTGAAEWSGGRYDGRIRVALMEAQPAARTRQAFAHEIVHACLARTGDWPAWLHEGLAQKLSGEVLTPADRAAVSTLAAAGQLPSLTNLSRSWASMNAQNAAAAYSLAHAAAEHLYTAYGTDGVRSLLQSPERLSGVTADLDRRLRQ
jgi:hypothetical protein